MADLRLIFRNARHERLFRLYGYIVLPVFSQDEIRQLLNAYPGAGPGNEGRAFHSTMMSSDADFRRESGKRIRSILSQKVNALLKGYRVLFANYIVKESGEGSESGLHQDWSYTDEEQYTAVNIWIPLSDLNAQNGILHVIPGSHELPSSIRYTPYSLPAWFHMKEKLMRMGVPLKLKPGEAVLYHPGILHFSPPNHSGAARIAAGAVMIPKEAGALHYLREPSGKQDLLEVFEVDEEFFNRNKIGERPSAHATLRGSIDYDHISFTEQQLAEMQQSLKEAQGLSGFLRRLFS